MILISLLSLQNWLVLNFVCVLCKSVPNNKRQKKKKKKFHHMQFITSTLVMSNLLPAVTECSWLVLECAPLEHWGIKHEPAPDLISGTRRDFVRWQCWFCSGFSFHAASVLLIFAEGGCASGLNISPRALNRFFSRTSEVWRARPDGVVEGQKHAETLRFSLNLKSSKCEGWEGFKCNILKSPACLKRQ